MIRRAGAVRGRESVLAPPTPALHQLNPCGKSGHEMTVLRATADSIERAALLIREGEVVAFPTETVYGLGADATNAEAAARIFAIKGRPHFDPLIVHIRSAAELDQVVADASHVVRRLVDRVWPGPLTVVLPKAPGIPDIVTAGLDSVAVRVPDHPVALELIERAGRPLAAPSANRFGYVSPTTADHVAAQLGDVIPIILDGGPCRVGLESTIVSFLEAQPVLLRPGGVAVEDLEAIIGPIQIRPEGGRPIAPGHLPRHYATHTPLSIIDDPEAVPPAARARAALLVVDATSHGQRLEHAWVPIEDRNAHGFAHVEALTEDGNLNTAAANLFAALRRLDQDHFQEIYALAIPERGLGRAIMDRLRRASHRG